MSQGTPTPLRTKLEIARMLEASLDSLPSGKYRWKPDCTEGAIARHFDLSKNTIARIRQELGIELDNGGNAHGFVSNKKLNELETLVLEIVDRLRYLELFKSRTLERLDALEKKEGA